MINKKFIVISVLILILISVQCVSAIDDTKINTLGDNQGNSILGAPTETKNYTELKNLIDSATEGSEILLPYNYEYNGGSDPQTGINITKNLIINGNGATIDGKSASALFNIPDGLTVTLKNLTIINSARIDQDINNCYRAITAGAGTTLNIINCTFDSNKAGEEWQYSSINFYGSVIHSFGNIDIQNSSFMNNVVQTAGVIYTEGILTAKKFLLL